MLAAGSLSRGLCFRKGEGCGGGVIAEKLFSNDGDGKGGGGKGQLLLPQGKFQDIMMGMLEGKADVRIGWSVIGFTSHDDRVVVEVENKNGEKQVIEAQYLIGADGGHSLVRKKLGTFPLPHSSHPIFDCTIHNT